MVRDGKDVILRPIWVYNMLIWYISIKTAIYLFFRDLIPIKLSIKEGLQGVIAQGHMLMSPQSQTLKVLPYKIL
jgi:hypothetical protein